MERLELTVETRTESGKGSARRLRAANQIPGVFYGPHLDTPLTLSVGEKELLKASKMGNVLITLKSTSSTSLNGKMAFIKDEQMHPVSGRFEHVDFYEVRMDEEIKVRVPVALIGKAKGVAEGGIMEQLTRELEVRCLPGAVPDKIEVDVTELMIGKSIHVSDITLPKGVKVVGTIDYTLAALVAPAAEEAAKPAAEAVAAEGAAAVAGAAPAAGAAGAAAPAAAAGKDAAGKPAAAGAKPAAAGAKPAGKEGAAKK